MLLERDNIKNALTQSFLDETVKKLKQMYKFKYVDDLARRHFQEYKLKHMYDILLATLRFKIVHGGRAVFVVRQVMVLTL